jgi:hypothetical protein
MTSRFRAVQTLRYGLVGLVVAAAILGVALWATLLQPTSPPPTVTCPTVGCSATAMGSPMAEGGPGNYSYLLGFTPSGGLTWGEAWFEIRGPTGQVMPATPGWSVLILGSGSPANTTVAKYGLQSETWSTGAHVLATSGQSIELELGSTNLRGQGCSIVMLLAPWAGGSGGGTISAALP